MLPTLASPVVACRYPAELPAPAPAAPLDRWDPATACLVYPSPDATTLFDLDADQLSEVSSLSVNPAEDPAVVGLVGYLVLSPSLSIQSRNANLLLTF